VSPSALSPLVSVAAHEKEERRKAPQPTEDIMKKNEKDNTNRILGRRLARELPNEELGQVAGGGTWTLLYPSDRGDPRWDGGGGPILV
jgi:hypothetical protein